MDNCLNSSNFLIIFLKIMLNVLFKLITAINLICVHGYSLFRHIKAKRALLFALMFGKIIASFDNKNVYLQTLYMKCSYSLILSGT